MITSAKPSPLMSPAPDTLKADEDMFCQMLVNLLDNAVKFTPPGGAIELEVRAEVVDKEKFLKVSVSDSGIGISPEETESIFDPLVVGEKGDKKDFGGLGTGLALTRRFVEFHGGSISVDSKVGSGSTFVFMLPMGPVQE